MLTIEYRYFCKNPDVLFEEILKRGESGMVEFNGKGYFLIRYQALEAANDPNRYKDDDDESPRK